MGPTALPPKLIGFSLWSTAPDIQLLADSSILYSDSTIRVNLNNVVGFSGGTI